jgi:hypothetical protein
MSVNFLKSGLTLSLVLLAIANGSDVRANDAFLGQPAHLQMPGNIQLGAPVMQQIPTQMPSPQMQMAGPGMQMSAPPMQQQYQPQQSAGYGPGPAMQNVDPPYAAQYARPQTGPALPYGTQVPMPQYAPGPQYCAPAMPQPEPVKMQVPDGSSPVDLVIEDLRYYEPGTVLVGPSYTVKVCNKGSEYARQFHIGLFASLDGMVNEQSPKAFLEVRDLAPGTSVDYTIRLPVNADSIPDPRTGQIRPFTHIATVADVFRIQPEGDETNNTAMLPREVADNAK